MALKSVPRKVFGRKVFSCVLRNMRKHFRELYGSLLGPEHTVFETFEKRTTEYKVAILHFCLSCQLMPPLTSSLPLPQKKIIIIKF